MTDAEIRDAAVAELKLTTVGYRNSKWTTPPAGSRWANALGLLAQIGVAPPQPLGVAAPQAPITTVTNSSGLAINVYQAPTTYTDWVIDGTFDSAVLVQPLGKGSVFQRFHMTRAASYGTGPGYGRHGFYLKAENVLCEDIYVRCDPAAQDVGSCFSVRDAGAVIRRFDAAGKFIASVYEDSATVGEILFEDGVGVSTYPDTGVWIDTTRPHSIIYRRCAFSGPGLFLRTSAAYPGQVTLDTCTWNGHKATAADTNLPSSRVVVL